MQVWWDADCDAAKRRMQREKRDCKKGDSAGRLIDAAGAKGLRIGSAEVSPKHANFIQADPGGSADDVHALMLEVQRRVLEVHGVELHAETRLLGFEEDAR